MAIPDPGGFILGVYLGYKLFFIEPEPRKRTPAAVTVNIKVRGKKDEMRKLPRPSY